MTGQLPDVRGIMAMLENSNPDAIAAELVRLGCYGTLGDAHDCPLTHYIVEKIGDPKHWTISVGISNVFLYELDGYRRSAKTMVALSDGLLRFRVLFDQGFYKELEWRTMAEEGKTTEEVMAEVERKSNTTDTGDLFTTDHLKNGSKK